MSLLRELREKEKRNLFKFLRFKVFRKMFFKKSDIKWLENRFEENHLLNYDFPTFDFSEKEFLSLYNQTLKEVQPNLNILDKSSFEEIYKRVDIHLTEYPQGSIIIFSGAIWHIYEAIIKLQKDFKIKYISLTTKKLSISLLREREKKVQR